MKHIGHWALAMVAGGAMLASTTTAPAAEYKIGASVALSGYLASIDRAWNDATVLAAQELNKGGGVLGNKFTVTSADMRSEPLEAVTVVKRLISSDGVKLLSNGCSSAGNAAAYQLAVRAKVPMLLCSILPPKEVNAKWAFSFLPPPKFEVALRFEYLKNKTKIRNVGLLYDPSPFADLQRKIAEKVAPEYGLKVVGVEQYKQTDADMTPYLSKLNAAGAQAIVKLGVGPSSLTVAKGIKQLGLNMLLLGNADIVEVDHDVGKVLGDKFVFVAAPSQVFDALPADSPMRKPIAPFLKVWQAKYGSRDPAWASRAWDAAQLAAAAIKKAHSTDGEKVRAALEQLSPYVGAGAEYDFTAQNHTGITKNPFLLAQFINGKDVLVK